MCSAQDESFFLKSPGQENHGERTLVAFFSISSPLPSSLHAPRTPPDLTPYSSNPPSWEAPAWPAPRDQAVPTSLAHLPGQPQLGQHPGSPHPSVGAQLRDTQSPAPPPRPPPRSPSFNKSRFLFPQQIKDQEGVKNSFSSQWRGRGAGKAGALGTL